MGFNGFIYRVNGVDYCLFIIDVMTNFDQLLLIQANKLRPIQWPEADELTKLAETDEARKELRQLASRLYHMEEYGAGLL